MAAKKESRGPPDRGFFENPVWGVLKRIDFKGVMAGLSPVIQHQDLKTTQVYLGRVIELEAIRWMDFLNGR